MIFYDLSRETSYSIQDLAARELHFSQVKDVKSKLSLVSLSIDYCLPYL